MSDAASARLRARVSIGLSTAAIASAAMAWGAFAVAIALGNHFDTPDPRSAALLGIWALLGVASLGSWIAACVAAAMARSREPAVATSAIVMALLVPCTWVIEGALFVVWFGFEALGGPFLV